MHQPNQKNRLIPITVLILAVVLWYGSLFQRYTFDLDESLYRKVAQEIWQSGNFWNPTWDGVPLYHKPPFFYWAMIFWQKTINLFSATENPFAISVFAARMTSFLSSLILALCVPIFALRLKQGPNTSIEPNAILSLLPFSLLAPLPMALGTSAIFDPAQSLLLFPFLCVCTRYFFTAGPWQVRDSMIAISSIIAACAWKGLNGIVVPGLAFAIQSAIQYRHFRKHFFIGLKIFLPATVGVAAVYFFLDSKMGRAFTEEFIWIHHFGRSQNAMETHDGPWFYHLAVLWLGGGFLSLTLGHLLRRWKNVIRLPIFPMIFALSFVIFFSFSATKLPHYTWPAWSALSLQMCIAHLSFIPALVRPKKIWGVFFALPVILLCIALGALSIPLETILNALPFQYPFEIEPLSLSSRLAFGGLALAGLVRLRRDPTDSESIATNAVWTTSAILLLSVTVLPRIENTMIGPLQVAAHAVQKETGPRDCIRYSGPHSPNLSLFLSEGPDALHRIHNRCDHANVLIVPTWKSHECGSIENESGTRFLGRHQWLTWCRLKK